MSSPEKEPRTAERQLVVERVQVGARMEKRMVKVLKALAEYLDISLGDLLEGLVLHALENKPPCSEDMLQRIAQLKEVYGMDYGAEASHKLVDCSTEEEQE